MSRRFSNLQYISIGILFGTCVFLWTRKLNLTKQFQSNETVNLRQVSYYRFLLIDGIILSFLKLRVSFLFFKHYQLFNQIARNENEQRLIDSWANRIDEELSTNSEDGEAIANEREESSNDQIGFRPKEEAVLDNSSETFSINTPNMLQEAEEVVDMGSISSITKTVETLKKTQSSEPVESVSDAIDMQTENTLYSEDDALVSSVTSNDLSSSISTTTNAVV